MILVKLLLPYLALKRKHIYTYAESLVFDFLFIHNDQSLLSVQSSQPLVENKKPK